MGSIKDKVAIIGMGCCKFGENWDQDLDDMIIDASYEAFEDSGVDSDKIQAAWFGAVTVPHSGASGGLLSVPLKLDKIPVTRVENYCATGLEAIRNAAFSVAAGMYDMVLAVGAEKLKDSGFGGLPVGRGRHPVLEVWRTGPGTFAFIATRYFKQFGLSREKGKEIIGKIAVKNHYNGSMHPKAHLRRKVTLEEVVSAPMVAWPYGLYDCCGVADGAAAAIICRADLAKQYCDNPIYLKGIGLSVNQMLPHFEPGFDWTGFPMNQEAARQAYEQAGIKNPRTEIDIAEVHDCFTGTELVIYEDLGFSQRGEGWRDVENNTFALDGELPVNTDGGLKAFGHPIAASGIRMTYEVYKQLQGKCGERQVQNARIGLTHALGGPPQVACVAVYGNELG